MLTTNVIVRENAFEFSVEGKGSIFIAGNPEASTRIETLYFENFFDKPFNSLKRAVEISLVDEVSVMSVFNGVIYFATFGPGTIEVVRQNESTTILKGAEEVRIGSGYPKEGDVFILKTPSRKIMVRFDLKKFFGQNYQNKDIFLKPAKDHEINPDSKRMTFFVGLSLLILLIVGIGVGFQKKRANDLRSRYEGELLNAETNLNQAIALATSDPEKSRELFTTSQESLKKIDELKVKDSKVDGMRLRINESRQAVLGEYNETSEPFLDLGLLSSGFRGDLVSVTGGKIFVLDKAGKKVISVEVGTKKSKVVAGPNIIGESMDLGAYEENVYILESDGIYELDSAKKKVIEKSWSGDSFIKIFGGNMYILDKGGNKIYRYSGTPSGFGDKQDWLSSKTTANFSDVKGWGLDGAIYVLYPNSKILKYSQGSPQSFRLSGITPEIGNIDALYADPNNTYLYLLDRAGKRVVVTDKRGNYKAQYLDEKIGETINLAVSEKDKKIILLTGEKLMQIEIKHLN